MKKNELHQSLSNLHLELQKMKHADAMSREILKDLMDDIKRVVEQTEDNQENQKNLVESLTESAEYFEATHPNLTALMNGLVKTLSDMGV
jgi:3-methyladenine DNA glycosylase AlkD